MLTFQTTYVSENLTHKNLDFRQVLISHKFKSKTLAIFISDDGIHQMELNPMMLTILGVVAGVLIVIILVTAALRIHTSRSRRRRNEASQASQAF